MRPAIFARRATTRPAKRIVKPTDREKAGLKRDLRDQLIRGGTVLSCVIIGVLSNGLFLLNVSRFWQQVIKGAVILLAVAIDKLNARSRHE